VLNYPFWTFCDWNFGFTWDLDIGYCDFAGGQKENGE